MGGVGFLPAVCYEAGAKDAAEGGPEPEGGMVYSAEAVARSDLVYAEASVSVEVSVEVSVGQDGA